MAKLNKKPHKTSLKKPHKKPLGEILVSSKIVTRHKLEEALIKQEKTSQKLGEVMITDGAVNFLNLYQALAKQQQLKFADLKKFPPDRTLLIPEDRKDYLRLKLIPWEKKNNVTVIAVAEVTDQVKDWVHEKYELYEFVITSPRDISLAIQEHFASHDDDDARNLLWSNNHLKSAKKVITPKWFDLLIATICVVTGVYFFESSLEGFFIAVNLFYLLNMAFKVVLFYAGGVLEKKSTLIHKLKDDDMPVYTLLVPMYKEKPTTIKNLIRSVKKLDYPNAKLDVKLIVETKDEETIRSIKSLKCEAFFEIIKVPFSIPQTKPKALNYALRFAKGEYVTIYDAEDDPEASQLKKVVAAFKQSDDPKLVCFQARLNYYNLDENTLTRMFAIEYSSWFDFMLPGIERLDIPMPLGGTSNHFRTSVLKQLYAWDPYNVTEDADLGIRLAEAGYKTKMIDSITLEESPVTIRNWLKQRARWVKGYMQTFLVHMRKPVSLYNSLGFSGFTGFLLFIGAPSLVFISIPFMLVTSGIFYLSNYDIHNVFTYLAFGNLSLGFLLQVSFAGIVIRANKWRRMWPFALIFPFYWILHIIASFQALIELIKRPHYWNKTEHGVSKVV